MPVEELTTEEIHTLAADLRRQAARYFRQAEAYERAAKAEDN